MTKSYIVDLTYNGMRIDRFLRNKLGKVPQSLLEKGLRSGTIKVNKKKVKSSFKVQNKDKVDIFNFKFEEKILQKKIKVNCDAFFFFLILSSILFFFYFDELDLGKLQIIKIVN